MNIRFSDAALRCRVTREELQRLLAGRSIALEVPLPRSHSFLLGVRPLMLGGWQLESDPTGMWLSIPRLDLEALSESLPSKQGLEHEFPTTQGNSVRVAFEVDVRPAAGASPGAASPPEGPHPR